MSQPIGYSYVRFSHPSQAQGDSLRRQTEATAAWCARNGVQLDATLTLHDLGASAFLGEHTRNADRFALAGFLKLVEQGKIPKDSYLVIENLDRLSRQEERAALRLWMDILDHGVNIVQLHPETIFRHEKSDMLDIMRALLELSRGHGESEIKSQRVGAAWGEKRRRRRAGEAQRPTARMGEGCQVITKRLPGWIRLEAGQPVLIHERAAIVKEIFRLTAEGYGTAAIVRKLTAEGVPAFGDYLPPPTGGDDATPTKRSKSTAGRRANGEHLGAGYWTRSYIHRILTDRRALGEFQPRRRDGSPDGEPLKGYFPVVVSEQEHLAARAGSRQRLRRGNGEPATGERRPRQRTGERAGQEKQPRYVNLFAGLLFNAHPPHDAYYRATRKERGERRSVLINSDAAEGRAAMWSFPFDAFESAIISALREINPREILPGEQPPDETLALGERLAQLEQRMAEIATELRPGGKPAGAVLRALEAMESERSDLTRQLSDVQQREASPAGEAWSQLPTLAEALATADDPLDARLRLRAIFRRVIERMDLLVVPRGMTRFAAVQIFFTGGAQRSYMILYRSPRGNASKKTPAHWWCRSFFETLGADDYDLRTPADVTELAGVLASLPLEEAGT